MYLLHMTPQAPGYKGGGELGVYQTVLEAVAKGNTIDYIGPEITDGEIRSLYNKVYELEPNKNRLLRVYDALHRKTNQRYRAWREKKLDYNRYDFVILEFTRQHYVLEQVPAEKLVVRAHNVEKDYAYHDWKHDHGVKKLGEMLFAGGRERELVQKARKILAITAQDRDRFIDLYGISEDKIEVIPICLDIPKCEIKSEKGAVFTIITNGSLWFGPNCAGIEWFLDQVYPKLKIKCKLILAGARPHRALIERVSSDSSIELVDTPPQMAPYLKRADLAVAPVFDGAGMKVKVAEALAYGLPVVGTSHAFSGYEIEDGKNSFQADTAERFTNQIMRYYQMKQEERLAVRSAARELYERCYSIEAGAGRMQGVLEELKAER